MSQWFLARNGQPEGPYDKPTVAAKVASGEVTPGTLVWKEGYKDWQRFDQSELAAELPPAIPLTLEQYAGFGRRLAAWLLDWAFTSTTSLVCGMLLGFVIGTVMRSREFPDDQMMRLNTYIGMGFGFCLNVFYYGVVQALLSGSPGKLIVGLRLVQADLTPVSIRQSVSRYFLRVLSVIPMGLGILWLLWDERKRTWHDHLAGTIVVKKSAIEKGQATPHTPAVPPALDGPEFRSAA